MTEEIYLSTIYYEIIIGNAFQITWPLGVLLNETALVTSTVK